MHCKSTLCRTLAIHSNVCIVIIMYCYIYAALFVLATVHKLTEAVNIVVKSCVHFRSTGIYIHTVNC